MADQQAPENQNDTSTQKSLNEEGGSVLLSGAHAAVGVGLLSLAFNQASSGNLIAGAALGLAGLAVSANAVFSSFFVGSENQAVVTWAFGKKMGNITGGGFKYKKPWPWRGVKEKVFVATQTLPGELKGLQTHDNVTVKSVKYDLMYRVVDPATFAFSNADRLTQMSNIAASSIRAQIGNSIAIKTELHDGAGDNSQFFDLKSDRQRITQKIKEDVNDRLRQKYGLEIEDVPMEAVLDERFTEAVAQRILSEQEGLAEQARMIARGKGIAGERDAALEGLIPVAEKLVAAKLVDSPAEALNFIKFQMDKEAQIKTNGIVILNAGSSESSKQSEFLAAAIGANAVADKVSKPAPASAATVTAVAPAHPADDIMGGPKGP